MNRSTILAKLQEHRDEIERRYRVKRFSLFGSAARDELQENSDIDVLVAFDGPATFDGYMDLKFFLQELLGHDVDLVTEDGLRKELRGRVGEEAIRVT